MVHLLDFFKNFLEIQNAIVCPSRVMRPKRQMKMNRLVDREPLMTSLRPAGNHEGASHDGEASSDH
jgi:hypothetical protein